MRLILAACILLFSIFIYCNAYFDTGLIEVKCLSNCVCKRKKHSTKVEFANCKVSDIQKPLKCSVEWPVLFLDVQSNYFTSRLLVRCQRLKRLLISSTSMINVIKADMFQFSSHLETLVITAGRVRIVENSFLKHLSSLRQLDISETLLTEVRSNMFEECPLTQRLRLSINKIKTIEEKAFQNCVSLKELYLNDNELMEIKHGTFDGLLSLEVMVLNNNKIRNLGFSVFNKLSKLRSLDINKNMLNSITKDTFGSISTLKKLLVSNNQLSYISLDALGGLNNLEFLDISGNNMKQLDMAVVNNLLSLKFLKLPNIECVNEDVIGVKVSKFVRDEFNKFQLCNGKERKNNNNDVWNGKNDNLKLIQNLASTKKPKFVGSKENSFNFVKVFSDYPYLVPMLLGALFVTLISIIVVAVVCHLKNKKINDLRLQEFQIPMMQSTL